MLVSVMRGIHTAGMTQDMITIDTVETSLIEKNMTTVITGVEGEGKTSTAAIMIGVLGAMIGIKIQVGGGIESLMGGVMKISDHINIRGTQAIMMGMHMVIDVEISIGTMITIHTKRIIVHLLATEISHIKEGQIMLQLLVNLCNNRTTNQRRRVEHEDLGVIIIMSKTMKGGPSMNNLQQDVTHSRISNQINPKLLTVCPHLRMSLKGRMKG